MSQEIDLQDLLEELGGGLNSKDVIQTRYATLFIKEDEEVVNIPTGEYAGYNGIPATLPVQTNGKTKSYSLYISEFHHDNSSQHTILNALRKADEDSTLEIRLDSPGGYCYEGIKLQAIMKEKFDGRTTTYNDVQSCSMGAFIFSSGDKRVMNEYATVMYHNYSGGLWGDGAALKAQFEHMDEVFTRMDKELLVGNGFLTKKEFKEMVRYNRQWYFNAKQCAKRGIATHIIVKGKEITSEQYLDFLKSGKSFKKYYKSIQPEAEEQVEIDLGELLQLIGGEDE